MHTNGKMNDGCTCKGEIAYLHVEATDGSGLVE